MQIKAWHIDTLKKMGLKTTLFNDGSGPVWNWLLTTTQRDYYTFHKCSDELLRWNWFNGVEKMSVDIDHQEIYRRIMEGETKPDYSGLVVNLPKNKKKESWALVDKGTHYVTEKR